MKLKNLEVIEVDINILKPAEYNPRDMTKKEQKDLDNSLDEFGLVEPLVVNKHPDRLNVIVGGHQRFYRLKAKGYTNAFIVYVDLPIEKEKELNLRLNKNNGHFVWDMMQDFDKDMLKKVGFNSEELDKVFKKIKEDTSEYLGDGEIDSEEGAIYALGDHRLICGDSTDPEVYKRLFGDDKKARLIYTDPPYNVGYDYTVTQVEGRKRNSQFKSFNDSRSDESFIEFLSTVFKNAFDYSGDDASFYCWHASKTQELFRVAINQIGFKVTQTIYWLKDRPTFSRGLDYLYITEPCFFGWKNKKKHYYNKIYNGDFTNVENLETEDFESLLNVIYQKRDMQEDYEHPTQKPVKLAQRPITRHSERGDIVLDMFGGSGSTLLCADQLDRICYTIELDPKFCDVIRKRYARSIGKGEEWQKTTPKI